MVEGALRSLDCLYKTNDKKQEYIFELSGSAKKKKMLYKTLRDPLFFKSLNDIHIHFKKFKKIQTETTFLNLKAAES